MATRELRVELAAWIWGLSDDAPELARVAGIRAGRTPSEEVEQRFGLKEIAEHPAIRKHPVWLAKLKVPERCGEWLAGRRSYTLKSVLTYLRSDACRARIAELNEQRRVREQALRTKTA